MVQLVKILLALQDEMSTGDLFEERVVYLQAPRVNTIIIRVLQAGK